MINHGGPAFPHETQDRPHWSQIQFHGMTLRDYAVIHAPMPSADGINGEALKDKLNNPYNETHKPRLRSIFEIEMNLRGQWADAMITERDKQND